MCTGNCEFGASDQKLKLDFRPADRIPDFFTKNSEGKIVFAEPRPMVTISSPKGHNVWLKIDLVRIDGQFSNAEKYVCLGIKKHSEDEYFDVLHMNNTNRYVDVMDGDPVGLIPLLSSTDVASEVILVTPGEQITPANFGISGDSFDFGSVYRINTEVQEGQWVTETYELGEDWGDLQRMGVGPVVGKENQLLATTSGGMLVCSSNGIHWNKLSTQFKPVDNTYFAYGNGTWCIINIEALGGENIRDSDVRFSIDEGKSWENFSIPNFPQHGTRAATFGEGKFVIVSVIPDNFVYISNDGILWNKVGTVPNGSADSIRFICYGNDMWLAINGFGSVYRSENGVIWDKASSNLSYVDNKLWYSGCFSNGYFYILNSQCIKKSNDGAEWNDVAQLGGDTMVCYKNKLYAFAGDRLCHIGFPIP